MLRPFGVVCVEKILAQHIRLEASLLSYCSKLKKMMSEHSSKTNKSRGFLYRNVLRWSVSSCTTSLEIFQSEQFLGTEGLRTLFSIECQNRKSAVARDVRDRDRNYKKNFSNRN